MCIYQDFVKFIGLMILWTLWAGIFLFWKCHDFLLVLCLKAIYFWRVFHHLALYYIASWRPKSTYQLSPIGALYVLKATLSSNNMSLLWKWFLTHAIFKRLGTEAFSQPWSWFCFYTVFCKINRQFLLLKTKLVYWYQNIQFKI